MVEEETRKGPWTEQEDLHLVRFIRFFGERRWDFIAKVSGLNRTGKSCRLRWVNYLHPDLKHGRLTPKEERLVLELHSQWGNRWSRIARKLPGRTDNEIKNYWRTHMRKKAQEKRQKSSPSSSSSNHPSPSPNTPLGDLSTQADTEKSQDKGAPEDPVVHGEQTTAEVTSGCSMEQIWMEIASTEMLSVPFYEESKEEWCNFSCPSTPPLWDCCSESLWKIEEELKLLLPMGDLFVPNCQHRTAS